jgi:hypothetical protein
MTVRRTALEEREDRKLKDAMYHHESTRRHAAEKNAGRTKGDDVRRRHAVESGELGSALYKERHSLTHRHKMEHDKHYETSRARPIEMEKRHDKELADQKRDHDARRSAMTARHRRELDAVED